MLKLENVSKFYYNKGIIASGFTKVNLELKIGEFVVITGESGSGKSTLLNVISGLDSYEEGEMYINGAETSHYTEKDFEEYRRKYIANIFQSFNLINSYTVYQNVELVLLLNGYKKRKIKKKVLKIIDEVGLTEFKNTKVSKLSGGQKQRVAIARAMVKDTPIIVADEPTGNLDSESAKDVIEILKRVAKDKLVVIVTHNIEQVEEYATRIIKMHDGRIAENREIKKIKEEAEAKESEYSKITLFNKYRLGVRNTFNILSKFCLLFAVFFFISVALLSEYAGFQQSEEMAAKAGFSNMFSDLSENRLIIKKQDKTYFTDEDYAKIKTLENIDYIVEDDVFIDGQIRVEKQTGDNMFSDMQFYGNMLPIENFKGNVDLGRMPQSDNEILLQISKDHYYITDRLDEVLDKTYEIMDFDNPESSIEVVIIGIVYNENSDDYNAKFYGSKAILKQLRASLTRMYSDVKVLLNNKYTMSYPVIKSDKVEPGKAVISEDLRYEFKNGIIKDKPIKISVSNIYYSQDLDVTVASSYTKSSYKRLTGYTDYEMYRGAIFVNSNDYDNLYDKPSYQSSVYVKDAKEVDTTFKALEELGFAPKKVTDYKMVDGEVYRQIMRIMKVVVTGILIVVLFFIAYLIIKIILKSRNVYYTTLRMLGATYKSVIRILDIELFLNSSLAYATVLGIIYLTRSGIINNEYIYGLTNYLGLREYVLMYVILVLISRIISRRFSRKIFKDTAISTYNEEV